MCQTFAWRTAQVQCRCEPWDWPNLSFQAAASDNQRWISKMAFGIRLMQLVQPGTTSRSAPLHATVTF